MIYLDNSATTKPYKEVVDSFVKVSSTYYGNPSSLHKFGVQAENLLTYAREQVSSLLQVQFNEVIFTSGGTEGNNLAIKGAALQHQGRGKHIVTTTIEHDSVHEPFKQLEQLGFSVTYVPVNENGFVEVADIEKAITNETILVSLIHVNNEVGAVQPVKEVGMLVKNYPKVIYHVDHVQGLGKVPLNIKDAHIDLCTISGHKIHGLKGTGVLYIRDGVTLFPLVSGGSQELQKRSGTENVAGIVSFAKALRLTVQNQAEHIKKMERIKEKLINRLVQHERIVMNTARMNTAPHIINITIRGMKAEVLVHSLEEKDIFVSTTSACSSKTKKPSKTLMAMGRSMSDANEAIRISLSHLNNEDELEIIVSALFETIDELKKVMR
ncbi:cysteine desulfurase family protein [Metabacillus iocasae]|uniref:Cysteine desulfurase n=1 Tax=Priestia iocasae TaxID=2291674 RepID=A0ABS2QP23_9BACI|nr:cysteine desulfurase family protein [Metabacillus iocasae]MBM7701200.1 cysteine desulfurase [Metabacillus iocasae]